MTNFDISDIPELEQVTMEALISSLRSFLMKDLRMHEGAMRELWVDLNDKQKELLQRVIVLVNLHGSTKALMSAVGFRGILWNAPRPPFAKSSEKDISNEDVLKVLDKLYPRVVDADEGRAIVGFEYINDSGDDAALEEDGSDMSDNTSVASDVKDFLRDVALSRVAVFVPQEAKERALNLLLAIERQDAMWEGKGQTCDMEQEEVRLPPDFSRKQAMAHGLSEEEANFFPEHQMSMGELTVIVGLMRSGHKIQAIKCLRAATGLDLRKAKAAVERHMQ